MIEQALYAIPPIDRDLWLRCAMAIKSELGDAGFDLWNQWSRQADNYKENDARAVWRSVKPYGGVTIGTLYAEAKKFGWNGGGDFVKIDYTKLTQQRQAQKSKDERKHQLAAQKANTMIKRAELRPHDYLASKGFPNRMGLVLGSKLLIPMRNTKKYIVGLQTIEAWGEKKFLPGTKAKGALFTLGQGSEIYLCEGYATALSVQSALKYLYRIGQVVVTFSAANTAYVAGLLKGNRYIIADHDESGTGERYARNTGLPYWMPPEHGDANDYHKAAGLRVLAAELNKLKGCCRP